MDHEELRTTQQRFSAEQKNLKLSSPPSLCPQLAPSSPAPLHISSEEFQAVEAVVPDVEDDLEEVLPLSSEESQQAFAMLEEHKAVRESMEPLTAEKEKYFLAKGAEVQKPAKLSEAELKEEPKTPAWKIQVPAVLQYLQSCFDKKF